MSQSKWDDLVDRLSSRKLWLAVLSIAFALWNHLEGRLSAVEFQAAVFAAVTAFSVAEGAADAVAAYRPRPSSSDQTVNVGTEGATVTPAPDASDELAERIVAGIRREMAEADPLEEPAIRRRKHRPLPPPDPETDINERART